MASFVSLYLSYLVLAYIGVSLGLHRFWAHREFKAGVWYEWVSLTAALCVGVYNPLGWIGVHRYHHAHADTPNDPHEPGWKALFSIWPAFPPRMVKDIIRNPRIRFFSKYGKWLVIPLVFTGLPIIGYISIGIFNCFAHANGRPVNRWWLNLFTPGEGNHADHHRLSRPE